MNARKRKRKIKFQALLVPKTRHKASPDPRKKKTNPMWDHGPPQPGGSFGNRGAPKTQTLDYIHNSMYHMYLTDPISPVPSLQQDFKSCIRYLTVSITRHVLVHCHDWSDCTLLYCTCIQPVLFECENSTGIMLVDGMTFLDCLAGFAL